MTRECRRGSMERMGEARSAGEELEGADCEERSSGWTIRLGE